MSRTIKAKYQHFAISFIDYEGSDVIKYGINQTTAELK